MKQDNGVYILVSPSVRDENKQEYRVAYLDSLNNITWELNQDINTDPLNPTVAKPYFDKVLVHTSKIDADEEAYRIAEDMYTSPPPIFHVYISTPYPKWSAIEYVKKNNN